MCMNRTKDVPSYLCMYRCVFVYVCVDFELQSCVLECRWGARGAVSTARQFSFSCILSL